MSKYNHRTRRPYGLKLLLSVDTSDLRAVYYIISSCYVICIISAYETRGYNRLTLKVLVATIDAQWEGMGDVGSARYEPALLPPCPTIRVLSHSS